MAQSIGTWPLPSMFMLKVSGGEWVTVLTVLCRSHCLHVLLHQIRTTCSGAAVTLWGQWGRRARTPCCRVCSPTQRPQTWVYGWTMAPLYHRGWTTRFTATVASWSAASSPASRPTTSARRGSTVWKGRPRPFPSMSYRVMTFVDVVFFNPIFIPLNSK